MIDKMVGGAEVLSYIQLWGLVGKNARDSESIRYAFKKKMPEVTGFILKNEGMIRKTIKTIANLELCKYMMKIKVVE